MIQNGDSSVQLPANIMQNAGFLESQALAYEKALKAQQKEQSVFDNVSKKYTQYT
jgi:hypothetical protein